MSKVINTVFKAAIVVIPFGAYQLYVTEEMWKLQDKINRLQELRKKDDEALKAAKAAVKENSKKTWW